MADELPKENNKTAIPKGPLAVTTELMIYQLYESDGNEVRRISQKGEGKKLDFKSCTIIRLEIGKPMQLCRKDGPAKGVVFCSSKVVEFTQGVISK